MSNKFYLKRSFAMLIAALFMCVGAFAQQAKLTGTVVDSKTQTTLPGVSISVLGTKTMAITDVYGKFSIRAKEGATLRFTFIGYKTTEVQATQNMTVAMDVAATELGEVVVTGLGITKAQRSVGFAVSTVKADKLIEAATPNFATALYGQVPGLTVAATPGGATSGVNIQIRGINSINFKSSPLIVMDGVPVRDGSFDNSNYWNDQRIRSNGLVDLNTEDMESVTVLKGASAAALYGSEATNGVILITTKSGKGAKGFTVDANANYSVDQVAYLPRWQKEYGAGFDPGYGIYNTDANGFTQQTLNGTTYRALPQAGLNFGAKFDGKPILCWDGQVRPYSYQENGFANLFQTANNSTFNVAVSNNTEKSISRFSYTNAHTEGLSADSKNDKNNFNLNNTFKFGKKVTVNVIVNYMDWHIHNRPYMIDRMINNFSGMFPSFDNGDWYMAKYKTSLGYKYVLGSNQSLTPSENIKYPNYRTDILDYVWNVKENNVDEYENRLNAVVKADWEIMEGLKLQLRTSTDYTTVRTQSKSSSYQPIAYGASGSYSLSTSLAKILYGDALLTYNRKLIPELDFTAMVGYNARSEETVGTNVSTNGGLATENVFDLTASENSITGSGSQSYFMTDAEFGTVNLNYKSYLYSEFTLRRDRTSTMNPNNNAFIYPSVNAGFIFTDAFKLPEFITYGKLRGSWGIVGSYPGAYIANPAYSPFNLGDQGAGSVLATTIRNSPYGNSLIKPEMKHEFEFGLEVKMLKNRLSLDATYYDDNIIDEILNLSLPSTSGATSVLSNVGNLHNNGFELGLSGTPILTRDFSWETGINLGFNKNRVVKLANGSNELLEANYDGDAAKLVSTVGQPMGDLYSHPIATNSQGQKIVDADGCYVLDSKKWVKYGNTMPKATGGFFNTFKYKGITLSVMTDFRFGGYVMPTGIDWLTCRGLTTQSLQIPGGVSKSGLNFYVDANDVGHETTASKGPNGETVMHDGFILNGVLADGTPNTNVISRAWYYWNSYNWGGPQYGNSLYYQYIVKNSYIKCRELSLAYTLPSRIASKIGAHNLSLSVFGRNLFYFYRTIKDMDAEQLSTSSNWASNVNNAGTNPSSRTFGFMLRANF